MVHESEPVAPGARRWILALGSFAGLMSSLDLNIVRLALPALSAHFHVGSGKVAWVQIIYILVLTCTLLLFGKLGDRWGFRRLFLIGIGVFTLGSLACALVGAFSLGLYHLLAARAVQALGGAMMMALTTPIINRCLPHKDVGRALGIVAAWESFGITAGRYLGGVIVDHFSWEWMFYINLPVGVTALAIGWRVLPTRPPRADQDHRFDYGGAGLLFLFLGPLLLALNLAPEWGWAAPLVLTCFALCGIGLAGFIALERWLPYHLLDLSIFRHANLSLAVVTSFVKFFVESGLYFLLPFYLMLAKQLSAANAGLMLILPAIVQILVNPATGRLTVQWGSYGLCLLSMVVTLAAASMCWLLTPASSLVFILIAIALIGLAKGLFIAPNRHRVVESAPAGSMGSVNAMLETVTRSGVALGMCSFETVFSAWLPPHVDYLQATPDMLTVGFRAAFLMGIIAAVIGLVAAAIRVRQPKAAKAELETPTERKIIIPS